MYDNYFTEVFSHNLVTFKNGESKKYSFYLEKKKKQTIFIVYG